MLLVLVASNIGIVIATFFAPRIISWYFRPPVDFGVNCSPATDWAMKNLIKAQFTGAVIGLIAAIIIWIFIRKRAAQET